MNKIVKRIEREAGVPGLVSILAERLTPTDLQSLLLEVYGLRSSQRQPSEVLSHYESDRFVRPSSVSPSVFSHGSKPRWQSFLPNSSHLRFPQSAHWAQVL